MKRAKFGNLFFPLGLFCTVNNIHKGSVGCHSEKQVIVLILE